MVKSFRKFLEILYDVTTMKDYQVIARRYRPQRFCDVLGQEAIVTTLRNMIRLKRTAHAYLFCGSKGTGKTTLARLFAKALNCQELTPEGEPCNTCSSCREIAGGQSLDILEIDGASNRGIEDIRKINETVGYASASGRYKIYIIDEVHMLTKEAFNALLKTLEEPPPGVKFFFATTEAHKVLPTILSRCQRFNLRRIAPEVIAAKLRAIASDIHVDVDDEALGIIATLAEGGLRDAESLFDQVLAFHEGPINADTITAILGVMPREVYFQLDAAGAKGDLGFAFEISQRLFAEGKDILHFIEGLLLHLRNLLVVKVAGKDNLQLVAPPPERLRYEQSAALYHRHQLLDLIDYLVETQNRIRFAPSSRIALEAVLLHLMRSHQRLPIEILVKKLTELEGALATHSPTPAAAPSQPGEQPIAKPQIPQPPPEKSQIAKPLLGKMSEDPSPRPEDFDTIPPPPPKARAPQSHHDTLLQFSAVELQGTLEKKQIQRG